MTIASEISRLQTAKASIKTSIENKGVTVPSSAKYDTYSTYIDQIQQGGGGDIYTTGSTFTITYTEAQAPGSFSPTWSDDAAGLTAGSPEFDAFFGYSAVRLNEKGQETAEVLQGKAGTLDITKLGTLTSGDNVMIKFPVRGIKMTKSGSKITLSITSELNKSGYQYYAFTRGTNVKPYLYLGAYKGSRVTDGTLKKLKSWSGQSPATSYSEDGIGRMSLSNTTTGARACARYNDPDLSSITGSAILSTQSNGYDEISRYQRNYINALYMMKYGNPNSQSVIGQGLTSGSAAATGATDSIKTATGATSTANTGRIKLFGLEDRWGNINEWLDGAFYTSATNLNVASTNVLTNTSRSTSSSPFNTNITIKSTTGNYLKAAVGTNEGMFAALDGSGSSSTYYCDYFGSRSGGGLYAGGSYGSGADAGAFCVASYTVSDGGSVYYGSRLMFL